MEDMITGRQRRQKGSVMGYFDELLSFADAAAIWGLDESTLRKAVAAGRLVPGEDCKKFGKQWIVSVHAMARVFRGGYAPWSRYRANERKQEGMSEYWESLQELENNVKKFNIQ